MSAPANGAKALETRQFGPSGTERVDIAGRFEAKLRHLKITALLLDVAAS